jgi:hypothetical protein
MRELRTEVLHVKYLDGAEPNNFSLPRRYTLTHSDRTGDMFLGVGREFCKEQVSGIYTRFMRDEVLAEWREVDGSYELHVLCHVSGGLVFGNASMRLGIFKQHMRLVLESFRYGDRGIYLCHPELDQSKVIVHFCSKDPGFNQIQDYGSVSEYD